ncbi:MAG TPA: hypothetical protein VMU34_15560 [Mycobacterium sp.]|nr:hypothetical protein [Mycobacterium sp.]
MPDRDAAWMTLIGQLQMSLCELAELDRDAMTTTEAVLFRATGTALAILMEHLRAVEVAQLEAGMEGD